MDAQNQNRCPETKKEWGMSAARKTAIFVGIFFLAGYIGIFVGDAITGPVLNAPDYLSSVYPNRTQLIIGMLVELLVNDIPVFGIGVLLFPILKKYSESIALWYLCMRLIEAVLLVVSKMNVLSLITLSREYISAGATEASYYRASGILALGGRYWVLEVLYLVFFILGALILYFILYRSKLVPRFISIWGFIAIAALIAGNLLDVPDFTQGFSAGQLLFFPIMSSEILLAVWLIAKGFNPSAIASESAR
jgi:hypothetical protein